MRLLDIDGPRPRIELRDDPHVDWVGRVDRPAGSRTTTMELQKRLLPNDKFLERVVAHEMVHHRNYLAATEDEKHGAAFREGAARVNAIMGPGFVVEKIKPPQAEGGFAKTLALVLGAGGLTLLAATLLRPRLPQPGQADERGIYERSG